MASEPMSLHRFRAPISTILLSSGLQPERGTQPTPLRQGGTGGGGGMFEDLLAEVLAHARGSLSQR